MNEVATHPAITKETVTGTMSIALTKAELSFQTLSDMESSLVYNEDNMPKIKAFNDLIRKADRIVDDEHARIKEPFLRQGKVVDESKREMKEQLRIIGERSNQKYADLCRDIEKRTREAEAERQRKQAILYGIDSNMVSFSQKISDCKTDVKLLEIERLINLEKANKKKYAEFYDQAKEKYSTLTALIALQKERIREFSELEKQRLEAEKKGDDEKIMALNEKQVALDAKIDEAKVTVQEAAINQSMNTVLEAKEIIPEVKTRHRIWTWEVVNILEATKKMPSWTKVEPVSDKIDEFMKASKGSWAESGKEEVIVNGIKFYLKKTY